MGTRADFYVGRDPEKMKWVGSIAWDGDPQVIDEFLGEPKTAKAYRKALKAEAKTRDDFTWAKDGWPWPWNTSKTTDWAFAFDKGRVWVEEHGLWFPLKAWIVLQEGAVDCYFPDMSEAKNVAQPGTKRSGLIATVDRGSA